MTRQPRHDRFDPRILGDSAELGGWNARYESRGYRVLTPAYPGFEVEVEALNADPSPIETVTVPPVVEHFSSVVAGCDTPPILMGLSQAACSHRS